MKFFKSLKFIIYRHPDIVSGIHAQNIGKVAKSQAQGLPYLLETNENLCIAMSTGTGKTLLYGIAAVSKVDIRKNHPQVLCVCATYEAAVQTAQILHQLSVFKNIQVGLATREIGLAARSEFIICIKFID